MKRFTLFLSLLVVMVTAAMAQKTYDQQIFKFKVTALNEAGEDGIEGGVAFIKDEDPNTFYHSNWSSSYEGGTGVKKGADGIQAFMVELTTEHTDITKLEYSPRQNSNSGFAKYVRIYMYTELPDDKLKDLSALSYTGKQELLKREGNTVLGNPVYDNNGKEPWANDKSLKTVTFDTPQTAKYILFVMDEGYDKWLTCSQFNIYNTIDLEPNKAYYMKLAGEEKYLDASVAVGDNQGVVTIARSDNKVPVYMNLANGFWKISASYFNDSKYLGVNRWGVAPLQDTPTSWVVEKNSEGKYILSQNSYYGGENPVRTYIGGNNGVKVYSDNAKEGAVGIEFIPLSDLEIAKWKAQTLLNDFQGPGYPLLGSDARNAMQAAIDADNATVESINAAIDAYNATYDEATESANVAQPEVGKVYRIVSALPGFTKKKAVYVSASNMQWGNYDVTATNQMWAVQSIDGNKIKLININNATYPQISAFGDDVRALNKPNDCKLEYLGKGQFRVMANGQQGLHANGHGNGTGNSGNIINYNTGADGASAWYLEEVNLTQNTFTSFVNNIDASYAKSIFLTERSSTLAAAVETAKAATSDYAAALSTLFAELNKTNIEYIDLGYFYLKSKGGNQYIYNNDNTNLKTSADKTIKSVLKFVKANEGTYYIQTDGGKYAQGVATSSIINLGTGVVEYKINRLGTSDHYVLATANNTNAYCFWHQDGYSKVVGWEAGAENTQWTLELLGAEEVAKIYTVETVLSTATAASVTYNPEGYTGTKEVVQNGGFYMFDATPAESDFTATVAESEGLTNIVNVNGNTNTISLISGYNGENIYLLRCVAGNAYARYHSGSKMSDTDETNMLTFESNFSSKYESLFFIEEGQGDYAGYYTIRPVAAPERYLYNLETADADSKVATMEEPAEGGLKGNYYWKITSFGESAGNITPFGGDDYGWNKRGSYNGYNHIGYWKGHNGSNDNKWYVRTIDQEIIPLSDIDDAVLGYATNESVEEYRPFAQAVNSDAFNKLKNAQYEVVIPEAGTYYRLKNEKSSKYMTGNANNITIESEAKDIESIFYVDEGNTLMSYKAGKYLDVNERGYSAIGNKKTGLYEKAYNVYKANTLTYMNNSVWVYGGADSGVGANSIDRSTSKNNNGYNWIFEAVTSLPVEITAAGYATWYAPVAVKLPEGVTAHTVTINGEWATLSEGYNAVPANTGVILAGKKGKYSLEIVESATAIENALEGTVAATYVTKDAYVLSAPNGEVGLYKAKTEGQAEGTFLNNSHKAYLPANAVPAIAQGSAGFRFGEGTTGIEEVKTENGEVKAIYDLTGRRVEAITAPGIYIINGKKVLVK